MRILELTNYSAGVCGVWARVSQEASLLAKRGYQVLICTSNLVKGSKNEIAPDEGDYEGVPIKRFPASMPGSGWLKFVPGGESFMFWNPDDEAVKFKPDVIIAHSYRHHHTVHALRIAKKTGAKAILVTHAPFGREEGRTFFGNMAVLFYDNLIGVFKIKKFKKVVAITKWEIPYLKTFGLRDGQIEYVPNGIDDLFFKAAAGKEENKILFFGRVAPIKQLELVIKALPLLEDKKVFLEIVGPAEKDYLVDLKILISELGLSSRVKFLPAIYEIHDKIAKIDSCKVFILPSKSEGMPQGLIEAMARGKAVLASDMLGSREIITPGENGFIFKQRDHKDCADKLNMLLSFSQKQLGKLSKRARDSVKKFEWSTVIDTLELVLK